MADMTDDVTFLGEVNLQTGRGGSSDLELDVERFFVNYRVDPRFNVQAGLFFTPIGYNNRFLYARAWLMNSIQVPDFFEEELNLFPTHSIGVTAHGEFAAEGRPPHRVCRVGLQRPAAPRPTAPSTRATSPRTRKSPAWSSGSSPATRTAASASADGPARIASDARATNSATSSTAPRPSRSSCASTGIDAYAVINTGSFSINAEYVRSTQTDELGNLARGKYTRRAASSSWRSTSAAAGSTPTCATTARACPTAAARICRCARTAGMFTRVFVPESEAVMTGVAYDLNQHTPAQGRVHPPPDWSARAQRRRVPDRFRLLETRTRPCSAQFSAPLW